MESGAPHALMVGLPVLACSKLVLTLQISALYLSSGCIPAYASVIVLALRCKAIGTPGPLWPLGLFVPMFIMTMLLAEVHAPGFQLCQVAVL